MKSCLIVDDSKVIRKVARRILEDLLDWNMPVMSGMEFLSVLRAEQEGKRPLVVFCTTENDMAHIRAAIDAGADEYIMKPFDRDVIEAKLAQVGAL